MADDELDELYWVKPQDFTAVRARLARAAEKRGDAVAAGEIAGCRKPTTAAWVVNRLMLSRTKTRQRLAELRERLRAAHAAMDGDRIRELSTEQRKLIGELAQAAFDAAELADPPATLRADVTGTLYAAVGDPDVTARLGRLVKAESWSGFGDFGAAVPVSDGRQRSRSRLDEAKAVVAAAERAKAEADNALSRRQAEVVAARLRHEEAERALKVAEAACEKARGAAREAADLLQEATAALKRAEA